jgi:hypothetical protein
VCTGRGFAQAAGELITFFPADGQFPAAVRPRASGVSKVHDARTLWSNLAQVLVLRGRL